MDRDLVVFVSAIIDKSRRKELKQETDCVDRLIKSMPLVTPWVFEKKPASSQDRDAYFLNAVNDCDIFVLLLAKTLRDGVKKEYRAAVKAGKPILVFIKDGPKDDDMEEFIIALHAKYDHFSSINELEQSVRESINSEIRAMIQPDWRHIQLETAESFRDKRIAEIGANRTKTPTPFRLGAKIILHLVPQDVLISDKKYEVGELKSAVRQLAPMLASGWNTSPTSEGAISYSSLFDSETIDSYVLLCRNGILEATAVLRISSDARETPMRNNAVKIPPYERELKRLLPQYLAALHALGIKLPIYLFLTLTGIQGTALWYQLLSVLSPQLISAPTLTIKQEINYDDPEHVRGILRKCFDEIANAWGYDNSLTFDKA